MYVIDEITGEYINKRTSKLIITDISDNGDLYYGYVKRDYIGIPIGFDNVREALPKLLESGKIFFSNRRGIYLCSIGMSEIDKLREIYLQGQNNVFPYRLFSKHYEAVEVFNVFKGKQRIVGEQQDYPLAKYLNYTFGVEFETSAGIIPEETCLRDGLIPLRDGSISGFEYSTVVLQGNNGISLLRQQIETLKKITNFNKECSLHIHFGGYPLEPEKIYSLYKTCKYLENQIQQMTPAYTFMSSKYKKSGKDYCKKLPGFKDFNNLYEVFVGRHFLGSLTQPHPNDSERARKWQIESRYYWVNFINMICYNVNKTVEFRFLRPTYNFRKITAWIYIFNAILKFSDMYSKKITSDNPGLNFKLDDILETVYPRDIAERIKVEVEKLRILADNQRMNEDFIGADLSLEDRLFDSDEVL